jgi:hypothetical protein
VERLYLASLQNWVSVLGPPLIFNKSLEPIRKTTLELGRVDTKNDFTIVERRLRAVTAKTLI